MTSISGLNWPGDGTLKVSADEAHAFTVHEFAKPRLAEAEAALERIQKEPNPAADGSSTRWLVDLAKDLRKRVDADDKPMTADDLTFSATARCKCGAGFCYPKFVHDMHGQWLCSAIILGTAEAGSEHDAAKPFVFWDIKGERQPSANGATTRP